MIFLSFFWFDDRAKKAIRADLCMAGTCSNGIMPTPSRISIEKTAIRAIGKKG